MAPSYTALSALAFTLYASYLIHNLYALMHPALPPLRTPSGALRPLATPLWAAAPALRLSLRLEAPRRPGAAAADRLPRHDRPV